MLAQDNINNLSCQRNLATFLHVDQYHLDDHHLLGRPLDHMTVFHWLVAYWEMILKSEIDMQKKKSI